jgi:hypothetical protein
MVLKIDEESILVGTVILVILAFLVSLADIPTKVTAATTNQTNITVQVADVTQITILPTTVSWSSLNPGSIGGLRYIQVRNSGSRNISTIYAYADTLTSEQNNPYPAGDSSAFSSGSVLMLKKNETGATYYYADRLEWNITQPAGSGGTNCQNAVAWGYYRNVTNEYVWCLTNGTEINATHGCNSTGTTFYIETDADNGTVASRQPNLGATADSLTQADWGIFKFTSGPLNNMCVAIHRLCTKILIYKYDRRSPFDQCSIVDTLNSTTILTPGDEFTVNLDAWVPKGIPYGWLASSWLTIEGVSA